MQRIIQHLADKVIVDTLANSPTFQRFAKTTVDSVKHVAEQAGKTLGSTHGSSTVASSSSTKQDANRAKNEYEEENNAPPKIGNFFSTFKEEFSKEMQTAWKEISEEGNNKKSSSHSTKNNR